MSMNQTIRQAAAELKTSVAQDATLYENSGKYGVSSELNLSYETRICTQSEMEGFGATSDMSDDEYADAVEEFVKQNPPTNDSEVEY